MIGKTENFKTAKKPPSSAFEKLCNCSFEEIRERNYKNEVSAFDKRLNPSDTNRGRISLNKTELDKILREECPITYKLHPRINISSPWNETVLECFRKLEKYNSKPKIRKAYVEAVKMDYIGLIVDTAHTNNKIEEIIIDADAKCSQICQKCGTVGNNEIKYMNYAALCKDCYEKLKKVD